MLSPAFIAIGSNLGDRALFLNKAIDELDKHPLIFLDKISRFMNTEALEVINQPDFLNAIVKVYTKLKPVELLVYLKQTEKIIGRIERYSKGPREIDLDILAYSNIQMDQSDLQIPHHSIYTRPYIKELLIEMNETSIYTMYKALSQ